MATDRVSIHIDHFDNFCLNHKLELDHVLLSRFTGDCLCYIGYRYFSHFRLLVRQ